MSLPYRATQLEPSPLAPKAPRNPHLDPQRGMNLGGHEAYHDRVWKGNEVSKI